MIFGELTLTHVAALFDQAIDARTAAERVVRVGRLPLRRVVVVGPADQKLARSLAPEGRELFATPVSSTVRAGTVGLLLGLLCGWAITLAGAGSTTASQYSTVGVAGAFGLILGAALGETAALRNDQSMLACRVRDGLGKGRWAVVVQPRNQDQVNRAVNVLEYCGGDLIQAS